MQHVDRRPPLGDDPGLRITLEQVREFLPRYKGTIAIVFIATIVSAYGALSLMTEQYEARAALLVKLGRENLDAPATAKNTVLSTGVRREELGSEAQLLKSPDLIARVVDSIGPDAFKPTRVPPSSLVGRAKFYAKATLRQVKSEYDEALIALDLKKRLNDRDAVVDLLDSELIVEPQKDADVIAMHLRLADPALAVRVQRTLIDEYLARRIAIRRDAGAGFLEREADDLQKALEAAEAERNEWKQARALSVPTEQKALLLRQIRDLAAQHTRTRGERDALEREMAEAARLAGERPDRVQAAVEETPNPAVQALTERLTKLAADRAHLLTTYQPDATTVRNVEDEIHNVETLIAREQRTQVGVIRSQPNPLRQQLEERLQMDRVRFEGLTVSERTERADLGRLQAELESLEHDDARLSDLERDRELAEQRYVAAVKRRDDARVAARLDVNRISNVSVAMPPTATLQPVYPRKLLIMAIALALGLALGVAVAILLEWSSEAVRSGEQVESLTDLVCLGSVSFERGRRERSVA